MTPRGNWTGKTKGGLILSRDQGRTFTRLDMPFGLDSDLDAALRNIENPNVNSGWVAMSPDCKNIVWSVADGINLPVGRVIVSHDTGVSFSICKVFTLDGKRKVQGDIKVFSDRVDSSLFYAFGDHSDFYVSTDGEVPITSACFRRGSRRCTLGRSTAPTRRKCARRPESGAYYIWRSERTGCGN